MTPPPTPPPPATPGPPPPPDPNNPRDLGNTRAYRRGKEILQRKREEQLTLTEPLPGPMPMPMQPTQGDDGTGSVIAVTPVEGVYNDHRNALEFLHAHHEDVRFCWCRSQWLEWNGHRWELDPGAGMQERARYFSEDILRQSAECRCRKEGRELMKRGQALGNVRGVTAMLKFASSDPRVSLRDTAVWDADPFLLGVENGVVDLRTLQFHAPERSLMMTKTAGVSYDPAATCPKWDAFTEQILPDAEVRHFMQVSAGYWLTGDTSAQCFWFCYGAGANGKSTFLNTLLRLCGDYAQKAGDMLAANAKGNNVPLELSTLPGVRFLTGNEVSDGMKLHESLVKDITGGDNLKGREHYEAFFNFRPACKLIMYGNHRPTITGTDGGMWRRVRLVPFTTVVPESERNPKLEQEFIPELPGILNWCLHGLAWWLQHGKLPKAKAVEEATAGYREDSDVLGEFLGETIVSVEDMNEKVLLETLYKRYGEWCAESGRRHPLSAQSLRKQLQDRGYFVDKTNKGQTIFYVRLRSELDDIFAPPESDTEA